MKIVFSIQSIRKVHQKQMCLLLWGYGDTRRQRFKALRIQPIQENIRWPSSETQPEVTTFTCGNNRYRLFIFHSQSRCMVLTSYLTDLIFLSTCWLVDYYKSSSHIISFWPFFSHFLELTTVLYSWVITVSLEPNQTLLWLKQVHSSDTRTCDPVTTFHTANHAAYYRQVQSLTDHN